MELFKNLDKKWLVLAVMIIFVIVMAISFISIFKKESAYREIQMEAERELEKIDEMVREITNS